jgi:predicted RNase H-like HicB family nuclease
MVSDKIIVKGQGFSPIHENVFIETGNNLFQGMAKSYKAIFEVIKDEEGNLCAADKKQMIFTDGSTKEELEANIKDAVECYFEVPYSEVDIDIVYI